MTYEEALAFPLLPMGLKTLGNATKEDWAENARFRREEGERLLTMSVEEFVADREHYEALMEHFERENDALRVLQEHIPAMRSLHIEPPGYFRKPFADFREHGGGQIG